jgi:hypothetical protein
LWFDLQKKGAGEAELNYTADTELSLGNLGFLPEYLKRNHLRQHEKYRALRIAQLESLEEPEKIEHTFLKSIKNALKGFLRA